MKKRTLFFMVALLGLFASCTSEQNGADEKQPTNNPVDQIQLDSEIMTPEVLWSFGRVSGIQLSPDKKQMLFRVTFYDVENNSGNGELFIMPVDGGEAKNITQTPNSEFNARWRPDGEKIGYLAAKDGEVQLWEMNPDGSGKQKISSVEGGMNGFEYAPSQEKILYIQEVKMDQSVQDIHPDLPKANARIETDLMYRHWDKWHDYKYSHIFVADYDGNSVSNSKDIMEGENYHAPLKPFGGM